MKPGSVARTFCLAASLLLLAFLAGCGTWGGKQGINSHLDLPPVIPADAPQPAFESETVRWETSWETARDQASSGKKIVLVNFTGSDWCHWCKRLKAEVFDQPEFATWAAERAVLLEVDFPRNQELPAAQAAQNQRLQQQFDPYIEGYPTVLLLGSDGQIRGKLGYVAGGAPAWIRNANQQLGLATGRP